MARLNVMIALVALLLCLAAVRAKPTSTPRRALKQVDDDDFNFDFDDILDDFVRGDDDGDDDAVDDDEEDDDSDFLSKLFFKDGDDSFSSLDDVDFSNFFSFDDDDFDTEGLSTELSGAFSSFRDDIDSILARYKGDNDDGDDGEVEGGDGR